MSDPNDITELSKIIQDGVQGISDHFSQLGANLSFDLQDPDPATLALSSPPAYEEARLSVINAASRLVELLSGSEGFLFDAWTQCLAISALRVAVKYRFFQSLARDQSVSYTEFANGVGLDEDSTRRVLGLLMVYNVFRRTEQGQVAHTRHSYRFATEGAWNSAADMVSGELAISNWHLTDALQKWEAPRSTTQRGLNVAMNSDLDLWGYLEQHPERQTHFSRFMGFLAGSKLGDIDAVFRGFDWEGLGKCTVIDVGGSRGHVSMRIAEKHPDIRFIVQDVEAICRQGEQDLPREFQGRITFQPHNFFDPQPPRPDGNNAVFLLKSIIHDWSDEDSCRIFRGILTVLQPGDRILLIEHILQEPREGAPAIEKVGRARDLTMMTLLGGKERTADEFRQLVKMADPRLTVASIQSFPDLLMGAVVIQLE